MFVGEVGLVVFVGGGDVGFEEFVLVGEFDLGEFGGGVGLGEMGVECGEFVGMGVFVKIGEVGFGGGELIGGLLLCGKFSGVF